MERALLAPKLVGREVISSSETLVTLGIRIVTDCVASQVVRVTPVRRA
jgi:hypothetical protein